MTNLYADVGDFRKNFAGSSTIDTDDLAGYLRVLEAASREIDLVCDRRFYSLTATRYFDGKGQGTLLIPDLLHDASTTVKLDEDTDGIYELTLADPDDYWPERLGGDDLDGGPTTALRLNTYQGSRSVFISRPRLVEIEGIWGYTQATEGTGDTVQDDPLAAGATTVTVASSGKFAVGQTLLIESEQVYVSAINGEKLTIARGVNGTTAAAHVITTAIDRYIYLQEIREATLIQAGRLWAGRQSSHADVIQNPALGTLEVHRGMDAHARLLISPHRRIGF